MARSDECRIVEASEVYYEEIIFGLQHAVKPNRDLSTFNFNLSIVTKIYRRMHYN